MVVKWLRYAYLDGFLAVTQLSVFVFVFVFFVVVVIVVVVMGQISE